MQDTWDPPLLIFFRRKWASSRSQETTQCQSCVPWWNLVKCASTGPIFDLHQDSDPQDFLKSSPTHPSMTQPTIKNIPQCSDVSEWRSPSKVILPCMAQGIVEFLDIRNYPLIRSIRHLIFINRERILNSKPELCFRYTSRCKRREDTD
jgi:hypothetical protein